MESNTHVVAAFQRSVHIGIHVVMIESHEQGVDHDAERNKKLYKGVKHEQADPALEFEPAPAAVPDAENVDAAQ